MLGACIWDRRTTLGRIKLEDYYPHLVLQAGLPEAETREGKKCQGIFMCLGKMLKGLGMQVVLSSVLLVGDRGLEEENGPAE